MEGIRIEDLIQDIRRETIPMEGHIDPGAIDDCWNMICEAIADIKAVYMSGPWYADTKDVPMDEQVRLWTNFRDALGLNPGTATEAGVGHPK